MSDELVGCICSSLAGLMGAVREAVTAANGLGSASDVLPAGGEPETAAGAGGDGMEHQGAGGLSPTHIASILLIILAVFLSTFRSSPALPAKASREARTPHREDDSEPPVA